MHGSSFNYFVGEYVASVHSDFVSQIVEHNEDGFFTCPGPTGTQFWPCESAMGFLKRISRREYYKRKVLKFILECA